MKYLYKRPGGFLKKSASPLQRNIASGREPAQLSYTEENKFYVYSPVKYQKLGRNYAQSERSRVI